MSLLTKMILKKQFSFAKEWLKSIGEDSVKVTTEEM
jgi:hypothetical protein